jgi:hypothetical protein
MKDEKRFTLPEAHREFAKLTNYQTWDLLEKQDRTLEENRELLLAASASLYHWLQIGTAVHAQRGHWLLSRVNVVLDRTLDALEQAQICQEITTKYPDEMEDFDLAFAQEALARSYALAGDLDTAKKHRQLAEELGKVIQDPEDKKIFINDLQGGNWFILAE